jgi:hypothetical protein
MSDFSVFLKKSFGISETNYTLDALQQIFGTTNGQSLYNEAKDLVGDELNNFFDSLGKKLLDQIFGSITGDVLYSYIVNDSNLTSTQKFQLIRALGDALLSSPSNATIKADFDSVITEIETAIEVVSSNV